MRSNLAFDYHRKPKKLRKLVITQKCKMIKKITHFVTKVTAASYCCVMTNANCSSFKYNGRNMVYIFMGHAYVTSD